MSDGVVTLSSGTSQAQRTFPGDPQMTLDTHAQTARHHPTGAT
jgi:hypothetical protein